MGSLLGAANDFAGVFGAADPASALRPLGVAPAWHDAEVAFGGAPVWVDPTDSLVVVGDVWLDAPHRLRATLGLPDAAPPALLAELYRRHGASLGRHAAGMLAVAIWDPQRRRLVLLRDAVGARTLYYAQQGRTWWFAARLRTLRRAPAVSDELNLAALRDYLIYSYVPGSRTLWRDAVELRPGTALVLPGGGTHPYWEPAESEWDPAEPIEAHAARLRTLLEDAVRLRLPPAESVGVFLSGGLDSSLITALAARMHQGQAVHTYAIHFGAQYPNELAFSSLVAEHCGTRHHVLELPARRIVEALPETLEALDNPIGDPLTVPNLLLGRTAAQDTRVILNGEGGDPCFGGPKNQPLLLHDLYAPPGGREAAYLRAHAKCYDDLPELLTPAAQRALSLEEPPEALVTPYLEDPRMPHFLNKLMYLNVRLKGADHILTKVNNLTSAVGLLGHSPLFDQRVVELSFAIPPVFKVEGANEKAVLKRAVADLLPPSILARPKSGMMVPVQRWFKGELRRYAADMLLGRRALTRPYLNERTVRDWLAFQGQLWPRHGVKLWLLLTLEVWLRVQR